MQIAGAVLSAGASVLGGVAANKAGRQNRDALYGQALEEENAGNAQALRIKEQARKIIGDQVGAQAANGFTGDSGSALDALTESQINATLDTMQVRRDAMMKARSMRAEGDMRYQQGRYAMFGSFLSAGAKLAGAASDWASAQSGQSAAAGAG
jgi:hypothetical protein